MIRKTVIVMCLMLCVATVTLSVVSRFKRITWSGCVFGGPLPAIGTWPDGDGLRLNLPPGYRRRIAWCRVDVHRGRVLLATYDSESPVELALQLEVARWERGGFLRQYEPGGALAGELPRFCCVTGTERGITYLHGEYPVTKAVNPSWRLSVIGFPLWVPVLVFLAYPLVAFIRGPVRRWRRRRRNLCIHCGYNLTALTESRCPECGNLM